MNISEVENILKGKEIELRNLGINFFYNDYKETLNLSLQASSPDIPEPELKYSESFIFENDATLNEIFSKRNTSFINYLKNGLLKSSTHTDYIFSYSPEILNEWIQNKFSTLNIEPENAYFSVDKNNAEVLILSRIHISEP